MSNLPTLEGLLNDTTVTIHFQEGIGTGFWVGETTILTCAHVVKEAYTNKGIIAGSWKGHAVPLKIAEFLSDVDLSLLEVCDEEFGIIHPCAFLNDTFAVGDKLYGFGYSNDYNDGESFTPEIEGISENPFLLKLKNSQIVPGFSGAPLLNLRTGGVCGIVRKTRDRAFDLGGRATPTSISFSSFRNLIDLQKQAHENGSSWVKLLNKEQKIYLKIDRHDRSFKSRVAELYKLLHYSIIFDYDCGGRNVDLFIQRSVGDFKITRAINVIPEKVDSAELEKFITTLRCIRREIPSVQGTIVSGIPFSSDISNQANSTEIQLTFINDLEHQLFDGQAYSNKLCEEIESNLRYDLSIYIEPEVSENIRGEGEPASALLDTWLQEPSWNQLTILGDVGTGKTFLTRKLAYQLALNHLNDPANQPVPIHIDLRNADRQFTLQGLILSHLQNSGLSEVTFEVFSHALSSGRIVLILDGFDEMAASVTPQVTHRNFTELARAVVGNAKVLLTCRTHYFRSRTEEEEVILGDSGGDYGSETARELYWDLISRKGFNIAYLRPFSLPQIEGYIIKVKGGTAKEVIAKIRAIYNLEELCQRPMLLEMIVKSIDKIESKNISAATLYNVFTDAWIHRDKWRDVLTPKEKINFLTSLSLSLYSEGQTEIHYSSLQEHLKSKLASRILDNKKIIEIDNEIRTASFLTRDDKGNYGFAHKSYREFFLAKYLAEQLKNKNAECLNCQRFSVEICNFLVELVDSDEEINSFLEGLLKQKYTQNVSENALMCFYNLNKHKERTGLIGRNFTVKLPDNIDLRNSNLNQINIEGSIAIGIILLNATIEEAMLTRVDFSNGNFDKSNLNKSDLSNSNLFNATFCGSILTNVNLRSTNFTNANLNGSDLSGSDVYQMLCDSTNLSGIKYLDRDFPAGSDTKTGKIYFYDFIKSIFPQSEKEISIIENYPEIFEMINIFVSTQCRNYNLSDHEDEISSIVLEELHRNKDKIYGYDNLSLRKYIFNFIRYKIIDFSRSNIKYSYAEDLNINFDYILSPDDHVSKIENEEVFDEIFSIIEDELSAKMVRIIKYRFMDDMSVNEIAEKEQMSNSSVYRTLHEAMHRIRSSKKIKNYESLV